jgi:hypothetical protein
MFAISVTYFQPTGFFLQVVTPAKARSVLSLSKDRGPDTEQAWIPACAGMTRVSPGG